MSVCPTLDPWILTEAPLAPVLSLHEDRALVAVVGALRAPRTSLLRDRVESLLDRGARLITLDLARLAAVDAAGVGELVRAYNVTRAAGGILRLVGVPRQVGQMLDLARVSALLARR